MQRPTKQWEGEDEVKNQVVALKDMTTGEQQSLSIADAIKFMRGE